MSSSSTATAATTTTAIAQPGSNAAGALADRVHLALDTLTSIGDSANANANDGGGIGGGSFEVCPAARFACVAVGSGPSRGGVYVAWRQREDSASGIQRWTHHVSEGGGGAASGGRARQTVTLHHD